MLCHINGTVDKWLLQIQNAEKWSCAHWWEQRESAGAFRKAAIIPTSTDKHNQSPVGLKAQTQSSIIYEGAARLLPNEKGSSRLPEGNDAALNSPVWS